MTPQRHATLVLCLLTLTCSGSTLAQPAVKPASKEAAKPMAPIVTASGLSYQAIVEGSGPSPTATDIVKVNYRGTFPNGQEFDSSIKDGKATPIEFPLNRVIKCWTEGVQRMKVGGKAKLVCPPEIAYGKRGAGGVIPPDATLNFDVELLGIKKP